MQRGLWLMVVLAACSALGDEPCVSGDVKGFDPRQWARRVRAATTCGQQAAALASGGFTDLVSCPDRRARAPLKFVEVTSSAPWRSAEGQPVHLLSVAFEGESGETRTRWSLLVAPAPRRWCRVETTTFQAQNLVPQECAESSAVWTKFTIEQLIGPRRDALHLETERPSCAVIGCDRQGSVETSWWEVREQTLTRLVGFDLWNSSYSACREPGSMTTRTVTWSGPYPRVATVVVEQRTTTCAPADEVARAEDPEREEVCTDESSRTTELWTFDPVDQEYRQHEPDLP